MIIVMSSTGRRGWKCNFRTLSKLLAFRRDNSDGWRVVVLRWQLMIARLASCQTANDSDAAYILYNLKDQSQNFTYFYLRQQR